MALIDVFREPKDVLRKVAYEGNRLLWADDDLWRAYTLFNFSVTAQSLRDWCLRHLRVELSAQQEKFHNEWNKKKALVAARDIANSSKHFQLRTVPAVAGANRSTDLMVPIFSEADFANPPGPVERPSYRVDFADGSTITLHDFVVDTYRTWLDFFSDNAIPFDQPDSEATLFFRPDIFARIARGELKTKTR